MDKDASAKIRELQREIDFLRGEVDRLRAELARGSGSIEDMLLRRGFRVYRKGSIKKLIVPSPFGEAAAGEFYRWMKRYSFRLFLRDVIKRWDGFTPAEMVRYSTLETVEEFCSYLKAAGVLLRKGRGGYRLAAGELRSFGPTLEWFVAEVLRREYMADAVWGVKFKDTSAGGDYDVLAAVEGRLVYAEVKSSPPKQIYAAEVGAFIERLGELGPDLSLFIVDTELRMKDKIVALFEEVIPGTHLAGTVVERFRGELFRVGERLFIVNSKDGLAANIGEVLGLYLRRG